MDRPSWDSTWMTCARAIAQRSLCDLSKVGAIIVTPDNRVVSQSYNGPPAGMKLDTSCVNWCARSQEVARLGDKAVRGNQDPTGCMSVHAEANALLRASWDDIQGATIYVTSPMCLNCAKLIANSGIKTVFHIVSEEYAYRNPERTEEFLLAAGINVWRNPHDRE